MEVSEEEDISSSLLPSGFGLSSVDEIATEIKIKFGDDKSLEFEAFIAGTGQLSQPILEFLNSKNDYIARLIGEQI